MKSCLKILIASSFFLTASMGMDGKNHDGQTIVFSRVGTMKTQPYALNPEGPAAFRFLGEHPEAFCLTSSADGKIGVEFSPAAGKGLYAAKLQVVCGGKTKNYTLHGLATEQLEGKNEPPLHDIFRILGVDADAGGTELHLSTRSDALGSSIPAAAFRRASHSENIRLTLIARYSPAGAVGFGFAMDEGAALQEIGILADSTQEHPDAHQRMYPPAQDEKASFRGRPSFTISSENCPEQFGFYYAGKHYTSLTYPGKSKGAPIKYTTRVYPASALAGRPLNSAYLFCFEEAKNGDYQDLIFLVEGIEPINGPE